MVAKSGFSDVATTLLFVKKFALASWYVFDIGKAGRLFVVVIIVFSIIIVIVVFVVSAIVLFVFIVVVFILVIVAHEISPPS